MQTTTARLVVAFAPFALLAACVGSSEQTSPADTTGAAPAPSGDPAATSSSTASPPAPTTTSSGKTPSPPPSSSATQMPTNQPPPAPPPWAPSDLGGLALWLRGDVGLHVDAKTNLITSWDDQSNAHAVAQPPMAGSEPTPGTVMGIAGVSFAGAQSLTVADAAPIAWSSDFTVIVIAASSQPAGSYGALYGKSQLAYPYAGPSFFVNYPAGATPNMGAVGGQVDITNFMTSTETALDDKAIHLFELTRVGNAVSVRVNGGTLASQQLVNPIDTTAPGIAAYIGGHPVPKVVQGFQGTIFEVIGVGDSMADADFAKLWAYAQKRYGIK